jgi:hypothetical protein
MAWVESHTVLLRHRKLIELAKDLRLKPVYLLGHLHALWHAALEQQEDGDLSSWSDELIAEMSAFDGDAPQYVSLLQTHGWLDGKVLHDWLNYTGKYLTAKYRTANPKKLRQILLKHKSVKNRTKVRRQSVQDAIGLSGSSEVLKEEGGLGEETQKTKPLSPEKLVELYNELTPEECPAVTVLSPARKEKAKEYLRAFPEEDFWLEVFKQIHRSRFLRGMIKNDHHNHFVADLDWLLTRGKDRTENVIKVHDGKYRDGR